MSQKYGLIDVLTEGESESGAGIPDAQQQYSPGRQRRASPIQDPYLRWIVEVVEYIKDDDGVYGAKVGFGDVADLKFRSAAQGATCSLDVLAPQFDAPEGRRPRRGEPFSGPKMRSLVIIATGRNQPRRQ